MLRGAAGERAGARHFTTRFKVDRKQQGEWLANPAVRACDVWPRPRRAPAEDDAKCGQPPPAAPAHLQSDDTDCVTAPPPPQPESPPSATEAPNGARVRACLAHHALEGKPGARMHATIEEIGGRAHLVLRRAGSGAAVSEMILSALELVDVGEGRVLIVPKCEPSEVTMKRVGVLTLEDAEEFWCRVHLARTTAHRNIWKGKLHSPWAPSTTSLPAHRRRGDSPRKLPAILEVPRAEAAGV